MILIVMMMMIVSAVLDDQVGHERRSAGTGGVGRCHPVGSGSIVLAAAAHGRRLPVEQIPVRIVRHPRHVRRVRRLSRT